MQRYTTPGPKSLVGRTMRALPSVTVASVLGMVVFGVYDGISAMQQWQYLPQGCESLKDWIAGLCAGASQALVAHPLEVTMQVMPLVSQ